MADEVKKYEKVSNVFKNTFFGISLPNITSSAIY